MQTRFPFNAAFKEYLSDCVFNNRPQVDADEVWMSLSKRASQKLSRWAVQNHSVSLSNNNEVAWLRFGLNQIRHVVDHRANHNVPADDVLNLLESCLPEGAFTFSPNDSGGNSAKRYPNQIIAFIATIKGKGNAINGQSPCIVMELVKLPMPHLNLVTAYWAKKDKIRALSNTQIN